MNFDQSTPSPMEGFADFSGYHVANLEGENPFENSGDSFGDNFGDSFSDESGGGGDGDHHELGKKQLEEDPFGPRNGDDDFF